MRNVWVKYTVYRLGMFVGLFVLFGLLGMPWIFAVLLGAMLSFAFSMIFLSHLRDEISKQIHEKRKGSPSPRDIESDLENLILDSVLENDGKKPPGKPKSK